MAAQSIKAMISPKDIAALAVFLASDAAKSISGQVLPIDNDRQRGVMALGAWVGSPDGAKRNPGRRHGLLSCPRITLRRIELRLLLHYACFSEKPFGDLRSAQLTAILTKMYYQRAGGGEDGAEKNFSWKIGQFRTAEV